MRAASRLGAFASMARSSTHKSRRFFADETDLVDAYMAQLLAWVTAGQLRVARGETFGFAALPAAHTLIQGGQSVGKIVCKTS